MRLSRVFMVSNDVVRSTNALIFVMRDNQLGCLHFDCGNCVWVMSVKRSVSTLLPGDPYQTLLQVMDVLLRPNHNKIHIDVNEASENLFGKRFSIRGRVDEAVSVYGTEGTLRPYHYYPERARLSIFIQRAKPTAALQDGVRRGLGLSRHNG